MFITLQQQMEALFVAAYLAAGKEFAMLGRPDLVQIAAQIGGVEAEHRAIGRAIGGMKPANNRAFETVLLNAVADAPEYSTTDLTRSRDLLWSFSEMRNLVKSNGTLLM